MHEARNDAIADDNSDESRMFIVDTRGDAKNLQYGSLHRYSVPSYHRIGYGRLIGMSCNVRINRDETTETAAVLSRTHEHGRHTSSRPLNRRGQQQYEKRLRFIDGSCAADKQEFRSDYIALRSNRKRKRGSESPEQKVSTEVDYRSIDGKAKPSQRLNDEDLEYASDSDLDPTMDVLGLELRQQNASLTRRTKEQPIEVEAWLDLVEHQAKVIRSNVATTPLTRTERRTLADVRLSIYELALKPISKGKVGHESLLLGMLDEGSLIWDTAKLTSKWTEALKVCPGSITLWMRYLDFVQTNHVTFRYEKCKATYVECLQILHNARAGTTTGERDGVRLAQLYVFVRFTAFVREAGYDELAYALWQLLLEYHFSKPPDIPHNGSEMEHLEQFWDSDVPRIGEQDAQGWLHNAQHGNRATRHVAPANAVPLNPDQPFLGFAEQELAMLPKLHLPATADDDSSTSDPFRHVMFSDFHDVLEILLGDLPQLSLVDAFLVFMRLPLLPSDGSAFTSHNWGADQYLRCDMVGSSASGRFDCGILSNERRTVFSLLRPALKPFRDFFAGVGVRGGDIIPFVDQVLDRLVAAQSHDDSLAEYSLGFKLQVSLTETRKAARRLLKVRPSSLRLYNAYALVEASSENSGLKADEVWATALTMSDSFDDKAREDAIILWHSWMLTKLHDGHLDDALHLLLCQSDDALDPKRQSCQEVAVTATQKLKTARLFENGWERMVHQRKYGHAALFAECHMWFDYLTNGTSLESALERCQRYHAKLACVDLPGAEELLRQAQAVMLKLHIDRQRPYKPALLRIEVAQSIQRFPSNSLFLELYSQIGAHFRLQDRIRTSLRDEVMGGSTATVIGWSFAIAEEFHRCTAEVSGSTENSVRSTFARALLAPDSTVKHSQALWAKWFDFEHPSRYDHMSPPRVITQAQRKQAQQRARQVFLDGLRHLPWSKAWISMGLEAFTRNGGMTQKELRQVYDVLAERELRARVGLEQMEDLIASMGT